MMSRRTAILTFMVGGPLLWLPVFLAWAQISGYDFHGQTGPGLLLTPALGGFLWYMVALLPRQWLYTWIPTLGTALLYAELVRHLPLARVSWSRVRAGSMVLHFALAAAISAMVFASCLAVGALLGLHAPFLPTTPAPRESFGVPNLTLSSATLIGMVSVIGGFLGGSLGAIWPTVEASTMEDRRPVVAPPPISLPAPSLRLVLFTFLVVGPLLYLPLISILSVSPIGPLAGPVARPFGMVLSLPLLAPVGLIVWYGALFFPPAWLQTWIPALGTAFLFRAALARFPVRGWVSSRLGKRGVLLVYMMICGALSATVFALCQVIDGLLPHRAAAQPSHGEFMDLLSSAAGRTMLMAVVIVGVILGGVVYMLEMRKAHRLGF
jgi:hypothetical protein